MPDPSSSLTIVAPVDGDAEPRQRFSDVLGELAGRPVPAISISDVLNAFGDRAFGVLMLVFAAPNKRPLPPSMSAILGAPLLFITAQLMLGRFTLWMPRFICQQSISRDFFALLTAKLSPVLRWAEHFLEPRMAVLLHPIPERIVGAACLLLAVIRFLSIPFGNIPPAFCHRSLCSRNPRTGWCGHHLWLARNAGQHLDPGGDLLSDHGKDPRLSRPAVGCHRVNLFVHSSAAATSTA
jgi:hypothetical protein